MTMDKTTADQTGGSPGSERMQSAAGDLIDQAGRTADAQASRTMTHAGDALQEVARAIKDAGGSLRTDRPEVANFADGAASQLERAATYLRDRDASEVLEDATDVARRQPVLVIGGALAAGLVLGRLLRSAADTQSMRSEGSPASRLSSGAYAGMSGGSYSDRTLGSNGSRGGTSDFENRTSELDGLAAGSPARASTSAATRDRAAAKTRSTSSKGASRRSGSTSSGSTGSGDS